MSPYDQRVLDALRSLLRSSRVSGPDDLPALVAAAGLLLGAEQTVLHLVDDDQIALVPLTGMGVTPGGPPAAEPLAVDGTLAGRAFQRRHPPRQQGVRGQLPVGPGCRRD